MEIEQNYDLSEKQIKELVKKNSHADIKVNLEAVRTFTSSNCFTINFEIFHQFSHFAYPTICCSNC
jgi:hypothetical protein